ncbi:hypothetical protein D3C86_2177850 [compost metagenome]
MMAGLQINDSAEAILALPTRRNDSTLEFICHKNRLFNKAIQLELIGLLLQKKRLDAIHDGMACACFRDNVF